MPLVFQRVLAARFVLFFFFLPYHQLFKRSALQESELVELRETIEMLKTQNTDAQTAIQVALNGPDHLHKGNEGSGGGCWNTHKAFDIWRRLLNPLLDHSCWIHIYPDWPQERIYFWAPKIQNRKKDRSNMKMSQPSNTSITSLQYDVYLNACQQ